MFFSDGWNQVPSGSTLRVTLSEGDFSVTGAYTVRRGQGPDVREELDSGSFPLKLNVGRREKHTVGFDASFTGSPATASVEAELVFPDGSSGGVVEGSQDLSDDDPLFTVEIFANGVTEQ
jgi:hypothetical protein